ncbi:MAG: hypothetical protein ACT6QS_05120 [Flavobacteriales bacterium]
MDSNVFDGLHKLSNDNQRDAYISIISLINEGNIIVPYSNAHINDLYRGYIKNPEYTTGDLEFIKAITNELCITQYWGKEDAIWHLRDPFEFFASAENEKKISVKPFSQLLNTNGEFPLIDVIGNREIQKLETIPLLKEFKSIYKESSIFTIMFPNSKERNSMLSLCEDIHNFSFKIQEDNELYKTFRKYLSQVQAKFPQYRKLIQSTKSSYIDFQPKHLTWDGFFDMATPKFDTSSNANYNKIVGHFTSTDLKGYQKDERFTNMLDDALHTFYAAHCTCFITNDKRCIAKAILVYKKLGIGTMVFTPNEFMVHYTAITQ